MRLLKVLLVLINLSPAALYSQDVMMLKDMSVIYGKLIQVGNDSVSIQIPTDSSFYLKTIARAKIRMIHFAEFSGQGGGEYLGPDYITHSKTNKDRINPDPGGPSNAFLSLLYPGLADYQVRERRGPYWIIGLVSYGLVGGGIYYKTRSDKYYDEHLEPNSGNYSDYKKANDYHQRYLIMTRTGAAIWIGDVIVTGIIGYRNQRAKNAAEGEAVSKVEIFVDGYGNPGVRLRF